MEKYAQLERIGEGSFGVVIKARCLETGEAVALKKIRVRGVQKGFPKTAFRECRALEEAQHHPNIIHLFEHFPHGGGLVLAFEYMVSDLGEVMRKADEPLPPEHVKAFLVMLLRGVAHLHRHKIIHRDLKPANLLISEEGMLKIGDFGLARPDSEPGALYSNEVATRWYRPPEILFGAKKYGTEVDMWSVACIFGEMLKNGPLFPGENDIDQLYRIIAVLGTPNEDNWEGIKELPDFGKINFNERPPASLEDFIPSAPERALSLLRRMLVLDPKKRITALEALRDPYFFTPPLPAHYSELPRPKRDRPTTDFDFNAPIRVDHPTHYDFEQDVLF
mmetsp:Transcript_20387/g.52211  ORF Transcript_20387/g.52211 Transcript_20387/m.52211 type:complete len:334 (+) Transcript_20387:207-1208(+)